MICYHGTDVIVDIPKILEAKRPLDFGGGFYVTTNKGQAKNWSLRVSYRNNTNRQIINVYEFDIERAQEELKIIYFSAANEQWLDFICENRSGKSTGEYDVVFGPVADDKVYKVVVQYENGDIDKQMALKNLKSETLCNQILFHTEKSLKFLKFINAEEINNG